MYQIKKNVPIPESREKSKISNLLLSMDVGDCMEVEWEVYRFAHSYARLCKIKVRCRAVNGVYTIWRIA